MGGGSASSGSRGGLDQKKAEALKFLGFDNLSPYVGGSLPTADELKQAYRRKAMEWHPDRRHNHDKVEFAGEMFKKAKNSYDHLVEAVNKTGADAGAGGGYARPGSRGGYY